MSFARLVNIRHRAQGPRFVLVSPATGILSCYGHYVRTLSRFGDIVGLAPRDGAASAPALDAASFAEECLAVLLAADPVRPTYVLGWKTGADLGRHIAAHGRLAHCALGLVALDPSFDFDSHAIFRGLDHEPDHVDEIVWTYFAIYLCGGEIADGLMADEIFRRLRTDRERLDYLYARRASRHDQPYLKNPYERPEEQYLFFRRFMLETHRTAFPRDVPGNLTVVARPADRFRAEGLLEPITARAKQLLICAEGRLSPLSGRTAGLVVEALGFGRE